MSEQMSLEQIVAEALAGLSDRERYILEQRCGYHGKPVSQTKIAAEFNISRARVGQIENNALRKLRSPYPRIKKLQEFLYPAVSRGKDDFYARLFIKLFKVKPEHIPNILQSKEELRSMPNDR